MRENLRRVDCEPRLAVIVWDWTPAQRQALTRLRGELEPQGVVYLRVAGMAGWRVGVPDGLVPHVQERLDAALEVAAPGIDSTKTPKSTRGRRAAAVSVIEANQAANIYLDDKNEFDAREDGGAYAVHKLYLEGRSYSPLLLSRPMVGHLITAVREQWLSWDSRSRQLRIPDEFRTSKGTFVIPRKKPTV